MIQEQRIGELRSTSILKDRKGNDIEKDDKVRQEVKKQNWSSPFTPKS